MAAKKPVVNRSNVSELEKALAALVLDDEYAGLVQLARTLAVVIDSEPDAMVAREYRQVLDALTKAGGGGDDDDAQFLVSLGAVRNAAVRNASKR
jgi:hypothetical protein